MARKGKKKSPRRLDPRPLSSSPPKSKKKSGGIKKAVRQAGPNISRQDMKTITQAAGGNVRKAVNQIAKVQQSQRQADKPTTTLASGAANRLIRQGGDFGTSKLGQTLQSMTGTSGSPGFLRQGQRVGATPATPSQRVAPGMAIRASGRVGTRRTVVPEPMVKETIISDSGGFPGASRGAGAGAGAGEVVDTTEPDPNQGLYAEIAGLKEMLAISDQRAAELSDTFNTQLMQIQQGYADQVALGIQKQQQDEAEARAKLMNQFRVGTRPDLRGVQTFNPQLAGTQGFKYRPQASFMTPAQVATAFTTPTTTTTTPVNQVLNI